MTVSIESIAQSPMFADVPAEKLQVFAALATEATCPKDTTLFKAGDPAEKLDLAEQKIFGVTDRKISNNAEALQKR